MLEAQLAELPHRSSITISTEDYQILIGLAAHGARRTAKAAALLMQETDRAEVVPWVHLPAGVVAIGSEVILLARPNGSVRRVQLVLPAEAAIGQGRVPILAGWRRVDRPEHRAVHLQAYPGWPASPPDHHESPGGCGRGRVPGIKGKPARSHDPRQRIGGVSSQGIKRRGRQKI